MSVYLPPCQFGVCPTEPSGEAVPESSAPPETESHPAPEPGPNEVEIREALRLLPHGEMIRPRHPLLTDKYMERIERFLLQRLNDPTRN